jgi:hypothetical protein
MPKRYAQVWIVGGKGGLELKNKAMELRISDEKGRVGTLMVGKAGIRWLPTGKPKRKVVRWENLDRVLGQVIKP